MPRTGRPKIEIDWDIVEGMAAIQCTSKEICSCIGIDEKTMLRHCKKKFKMTFADYLDQKRDLGRKSLRRRQYELAKSGNATMLVWLGKQWLGQKDKQEISGPDNGPIQVENLPTHKLREELQTTLKALFPENDRPNQSKPAESSEG